MTSGSRESAREASEQLGIAFWDGASQGAAQVEHRVLSLRTGERNSILAVVNEHPKIKRRALRRCGGGSRTPRPSPQE